MRRPSLLGYVYLRNGKTIEKERTQKMPKTINSKTIGVWKSTSTMVGLGLILVLILSACSVSASTANISAATMAQDEAGKNPTKVFSPNDQTFYCIAELSNAPEDTTVKAVWTAVDVEGVKPNLKIDESSITADESGQLTFDLTNDGPWPVGEYKVDLFLNDDEEPARTLEFEAQ
jgi:hypothetical protein